VNCLRPRPPYLVRPLGSARPARSVLQASPPPLSPSPLGGPAVSVMPRRARARVTVTSCLRCEVATPQIQLNPKPGGSGMCVLALTCDQWAGDAACAPTRRPYRVRAQPVFSFFMAARGTPARRRRTFTHPMHTLCKVCLANLGSGPPARVQGPLHGERAFRGVCNERAIDVGGQVCKCG
jgi:hypothetical protein